MNGNQGQERTLCGAWHFFLFFVLIPARNKGFPLWNAPYSSSNDKKLSDWYFFSPMLDSNFIPTREEIVCSSHMFRHVIFFVDLQFYCLVDMHQRLHPLTDRVETSIKGVEYFKDIFDLKQKHY